MFPLGAIRDSHRCRDPLVTADHIIYTESGGATIAFSQQNWFNFLIWPPLQISWSWPTHPPIPGDAAFADEGELLLFLRHELCGQFDKKKRNG